MFSNLNFWEVGGLLLLALFIFGPERLPKVISDGVRLLRNVRETARHATSDLSRELGTEVSLEDLHPKAFIRKHLLSEDEEDRLRRPFDEAYRDLKQIASDTNDVASRRDVGWGPDGRSPNGRDVESYGSPSGPLRDARQDDDPQRYDPQGYGDLRRFDTDAT